MSSGASAAQDAMVHITTVPGTLSFLSGQPAFMRRRFGLQVHAISAPGPELAAFRERQRVAIHAVSMERRITPLRDLGALWRIWRILRRLRPLIVDAHTPKGGLLGMLAAWLARVPVRVYHLHGLPLVTATGARRCLLRWTERISCALAHRVLAVSRSIAAVAVHERLCVERKIRVLRHGSINGVDTDRFTPASEQVRIAVRSAHGIGVDDRVIGFVGRLASEKGIAELGRAWALLREGDERLWLVLVGEADASDPPGDEVLAPLRADPRVLLKGPIGDVAPLYATMDVVALPTYREGFPVVALEAAAAALPIVATAVVGCVDAVEDGVTGTLVPARDAAALARALDRYLRDPALRRAHGEAARRRARAYFRPEAIWETIAAEYAALLAPARAPSNVAACVSGQVPWVRRGDVRG